MQERSPRYPTYAAVQLSYHGSACDALAVDVGLGGLCLYGVGGLPVGLMVSVRHLGLDFAAQVAWSKDLFTGVRFLIPLQPTELQAFRVAPVAWAA